MISFHCEQPGHAKDDMSQLGYRQYVNHISGEIYIIFTTGILNLKLHYKKANDAKDSILFNFEINNPFFHFVIPEIWRFISIYFVFMNVKVCLSHFLDFISNMCKIFTFFSSNYPKIIPNTFSTMFQPLFNKVL